MFRGESKMDNLEKELQNKFVWIFNGSLGDGVKLPSGVFLAKEKAQKWIDELGIKGLLTPYPVDISAYDWSVQNKWFTPKKPHHYSPEFIGAFTGGHMHFHFDFENRIDG
jgi:hypothetical protein